MFSEARSCARRERDAERVLNDLGGAVTVLAVVFFFEKLGHLYAH
jgi:hypothetical protein